MKSHCLIKPIIKFLTLSIISSFLLADVIMTELTDPQNSSDAGRYVELYNNGDSDVDLSTGWALQRWTNGNADPQSAEALTGTIAAGGFYIVCNNADKYNTTYGLTCDQDFGTGDAADSNGDDNIALLDASGTITDMFGVAGEDGSGTGHEFEDGRAERAADNITASATWDASGWNIDNDSGGGDGNQYAPEGFDPGEWIGATSGEPECADDADCDYLNDGCLVGACDTDGACFSSSLSDGTACDDGNATTDNDACVAGVCIGENACADVDTDGVCDDVDDCVGAYDDCSVCNGDGTSCYVDVTFSVDMNIEGVVGDVKVRTSTVDGTYSPSDWFAMDDSDGDLVYTHTLSLKTGVEYGYNFNDSNGSGYESGDTLTDCGGGNYGNDRYVTPGDSDITLDTVCWESCEECPDVILGCTDPDASNYDSSATEDDSSCTYPQPMQNLFFSEHAEGSSSNKYFEIYNPSDVDVNLNDYVFVNCSNGCDDWEYTNSFSDGAVIAAGDVYAVCHGSFAGDLSLCSEIRTLYHNGDDAQGLMYLPSTTLLDVYGEQGADPGSGWAVAGTANATKDHTLVRKSDIDSGNTDWTLSAGTNSDDSEWVVLEKDTWDYLGSHPHT
ncbi:lamin tail domain-containing protein, partial [bacterium]|nr:lamin tail domain-containing protein [bacterium]